MRIGDDAAWAQARPPASGPAAANAAVAAEYFRTERRVVLLMLPPRLRLVWPHFDRPRARPVIVSVGQVPRTVNASRSDSGIPRRPWQEPATALFPAT